MHGLTPGGHSTVLWLLDFKQRSNVTAQEEAGWFKVYLPMFSKYLTREPILLQLQKLNWTKTPTDVIYSFFYFFFLNHSPFFKKHRGGKGWDKKHLEIPLRLLLSTCGSAGELSCMPLLNLLRLLALHLWNRIKRHCSFPVHQGCKPYLNIIGLEFPVKGEWLKIIYFTRVLCESQSSMPPDHGRKLCASRRQQASPVICRWPARMWLRGGRRGNSLQRTLLYLSTQQRGQSPQSQKNRASYNIRWNSLTSWLPLFFPETSDREAIRKGQDF